MPTITILIYKKIETKEEAEILFENLKDKFTDAKTDEEIKISAQYQESIQ